MTLICLALNHLTTHQVKSTLTNALLVFWDMKWQLLQQISLLADAEDTPPPKWRLKCNATGEELLLNRLIPQLTEQEKEEVSPIQKQSKISFIWDKKVTLCNKKKLIKNSTKLQYQTNDWSYSVNTKNHKQTLLNFSFIVHVNVSLQLLSARICCFT